MFNISFEPMNFISSSKYMLIGMLCIFIVIGAIIVVTTLLNKIFSGKDKKDK